MVGTIPILPAANADARIIAALFIKSPFRLSTDNWIRTCFTTHFYQQNRAAKLRKFFDATRAFPPPRRDNAQQAQEFNQPGNGQFATSEPPPNTLPVTTKKY
jgi:hypothetical protein